jgi:hypothetical protein
VRQQIFERPVSGPASRQMTSRMGVGVRQTGQDDASGRVDPPGVGGRGDRRADPDDPVLLDEEVSPRERRGMTREDLTAADEK